MDTEWIYLLVGGPPGTTEFPLFRECLVGFVLGPLTKKWHERGFGEAIPATALGCDPQGQRRSISFHAVELFERLMHTTGADDFVLVDQGRGSAENGSGAQ